MVSIPASGFTSFTLASAARILQRQIEVSIPASGFTSFTHIAVAPDNADDMLVSIPASGFTSFTLRVSGVLATCVDHVSIPASGFTSFTLGQLRFQIDGPISFNPRIGIHFIHAPAARPSDGRFDVSIPASGFTSFTLAYRRSADNMGKTFQSPHRDSLHSRLHRARSSVVKISGFNPRIGIHFIHASCNAIDGTRQAGCFNPRIGIHFIHASQQIADMLLFSTVSIPASGFTSFTHRRCERLT